MKAIPNNYLFSKSDLKKLIIPLLAEQFLNMIVGLVDSVMAASAGEAAVSGVSLINNMSNLVITLLAALAMGGGVVVGQCLGKKKEQEACSASNQTFILTSAISVGVMIGVYLLQNVILYKIYGGAEADVLDCAKTYLLIVTASFPFVGIYNAGAAIFRTSDDSRTPMIISVGMNLINILGNAILIYGFKMGVAGVAIPTLVSRIFAGVVITKKIANKNLRVHTEKELKINFSKMKQIMGIGIPNSIGNSLSQLGQVIISTVIVSFGTSSIAAHTVSASIASFATIPVLAISQAVLAVVSRCYGAGDMEQLRFYMKQLLKMMYKYTIIVGVAVVALMPVVLKVYNLSEESTTMARDVIIFYVASACIFLSPSIEFPSGLRAMNDSLFTMVASIAIMWTFNIGLSIVFGTWLGLGLLGVWIAGTVEMALQAAIFPIRYRVILKRNCKTEKEF